MPVTLSYEQALARLTAPGQPFELAPHELSWGSAPAFVNAPTTLRDVYDRAGSAFGPHELWVAGERRSTYAAGLAAAGTLALGLERTFGLGLADRVGIAMVNRPEWLTTYLAVTGSGWIGVPLNSWWTGEELGYAVVDSGCRLVVADRRRADALAGLPTPPAVVVVDPDRPLHANEYDLAEVVAAGDTGDADADAGPAVDARPDAAVDPSGRGGPWWPTGEVGPDDPAAILYTSGTTGRPKGAICTHRNIVNALMGFHCAASVGALRAGIDPSSAPPGAMLVPVPLFHVTGCHTVFLTSFLSGRKLVLMSRWDPDEALRLIEAERITAFTGVPTMVWDMLRSPERARRDTSSLRVIGNGGAPASPELSRQVDAVFEGRPGHGYGMTESSGSGAQVNGDDHLERLGSPGRIPPMLLMEAFDDTGRQLPRGEVGELRMRGVVVTPGYWGDDEATAAAFDDGWFLTGDVGSVNEDGFLHLRGRSKDMVLRGGENVYCVEVERAVQDLPEVREVVVYPLPDDRLGEVVGATVYSVIDTDGGTGTGPGANTDLTARLEGQLARFKIPQVVRWVREPLPRLASGKFDKRAAVAAHLSVLERRDEP